MSPPPAAPRRLLSVAEYVAFETRAATRHEYVAGRVYAMSGESRAHNQIALNVAARLRAAARGGACRVSMEGVRLVADARTHYYPDVMVACGPPPDDPLVETAPCVLVEVLSPSTRRTDRREKGLAYRALASLRTYLVVYQDRRRVEWYARGDDGEWTVADLVGDGTVRFPCPGPPGGPVEMTFDELYEAVALPPAPAPRPERP